MQLSLQQRIEQPNHLAELLVDVLRQLRLEHDRVLSLEADVESYRTLSQQAIHALHDLAGERDRLRAANRRLAGELRTLRPVVDPDQVAA